MGSRASQVTLKSWDLLLMGTETQKSWFKKRSNALRKMNRSDIGTVNGKASQLGGCGQKAAVRGPGDLPKWHLQVPR